MPSGTNRTRTHADLSGQVHLLCARLNVGGLGLMAVGGRDHRGTVITAGKEKLEPWDCRIDCKKEVSRLSSGYRNALSAPWTPQEKLKVNSDTPQGGSIPTCRDFSLAAVPRLHECLA